MNTIKNCVIITTDTPIETTVNDLAMIVGCVVINVKGGNTPAKITRAIWDVLEQLERNAS